MENSKTDISVISCELNRVNTVVVLQNNNNKLEVFIIYIMWCLLRCFKARNISICGKKETKYWYIVSN